MNRDSWPECYAACQIALLHSAPQSLRCVRGTGRSARPASVQGLAPPSYAHDSGYHAAAVGCWLDVVPYRGTLDRGHFAGGGIRLGAHGRWLGTRARLASIARGTTGRASFGGCSGSGTGLDACAGHCLGGVASSPRRSSAINSPTALCLRASSSADRRLTQLRHNSRTRIQRRSGSAPLLGTGPLRRQTHGSNETIRIGTACGRVPARAAMPTAGRAYSVPAL